VHDQVSRKSALQRALFWWALRVGAQRMAPDGGPGVRLWVRLADRLVLDSLRRRLTGGRLRFFISGGAPLNEKVEQFFWALGVKILQGWGMTETTSGATSNSETLHRYRSVGPPLPGLELKLADDGEILVRGPIVTSGYYNLPQATAQVLSADGWLSTGDMGFLADGFLTITDRKKDLIKTSGGKYIAPLPIEARLQAERALKAALVIGNERPYAVALIVPDWDAVRSQLGIAGMPAELKKDPRVRGLFQELVDQCNRDLASFESIKRFALLERDFAENLDELTPTLKPKRKVIGEHFAAEIEALYSASRLDVASPPATAT
jgi:long-chain acyl-CoA synthetase